MKNDLRKQNPPLKTDFSRDAIEHRMIRRNRCRLGANKWFMRQARTENQSGNEK
jgi:hypothetical protein